MSSLFQSFKGWCIGSKRDRRNELRVLAWMAPWAVAFLTLEFAISEEWLPAGWPVVLAILVVAALGLGVLLAYRRFLRQADELRRKIELEGLALAFAVAILGGLMAGQLISAGLLSGDGVLQSMVSLMLVAYSLGVLLGYRRYS